MYLIANFKLRTSVDWFKYILLLPLIVWLGLFVAFPLLDVTLMSFMKSGTYGGVELGFSLNNYGSLFSALYGRIIILSFVLALVVTLICIVMAYPFAMFVANKSKAILSVITALITTPFMISSVLRLYAWITILRTNGILNSSLMKIHIIGKPLDLVYNNFAVVLGMVYTLIPFMLLPLISGFRNVDISLVEATQDLGGKKWEIFKYVYLPTTLPAIFSGSIMVFIPTLGYFFVSDIMGGSKSIFIGNLVRDQFISAHNWPLGSALSVAIIAFTFLILWIYKKMGGRLEDLGGN
ncbi:ABC transporter permease [Lactococcus kimchii]|nr:ABC transporter permease [Lactococcus sp. S-13]